MNAKTPIREVLHLLDLEKIEENIHRGASPKDRVQRVFGGQARRWSRAPAASTAAFTGATASSPLRLPRKG